MKKTLIIPIILLVLSSCGATYKMNLSLLTVDVKSDKSSYQSTNVRDTLMNDMVYMTFKDSIVDIKWVQGKNRFVLLLENLSEETMKINWDEVTYVNPFGLAERLWHATGFYSHSDIEQVPTIIPSKKSILEPIVQESNIFFYKVWREKRLLVYKFENNKQVDSYLGKPVQLYLPIYVGDKKVEYKFNFYIWIMTPVQY